MTEGTGTEYAFAGQQPRSEKERTLPDYAWRELDMARSGYSIFGSPITHEQRRTVFAKWGLGT